MSDASDRRYWAEHAWLPDRAGRRRPVRGRRRPVRRRAPPGAAAEAGDERLPGVVLPGFANAHSHAFHRALRGRTHGDGGNFWTWREQMYAVPRHLDPDTYLALARAVFAEMVLAGITVVGEFHYLHHAPAARRYDDPNAMGAGADPGGARRPGIRLTLLDTCYLAGGLTGDGHLPLDDGAAAVHRRRRRRAGRRGWPPWRPTPTTRGSARPCTRCGRCRATTCGRWPRSTRGPRRARPLSRAAGREPRRPDVLRRTPDRAARRGRAARRPVHARSTPPTCPTATSSCSAARGTTACFCPTTERDLADGIGPARALHRRRAPRCRSAPTSTRSSTRSRRCAGSRCTSGSPATSAAASRPTSC